MKRLVEIALLILMSLIGMTLKAQFNCGSNTPIFQVNLSSNPNATYQSPDTVRIDTCCGATNPDKCVGFEVTLHPLAEGIIFEICDGATPPGAIFYQVNCGSPTPVGEALCLSGVGPHYITFCKPGNNSNVYCITSISEPIPGPNVAINDGCSGSLYVEGFDPDSVTWSSIYPGPIGAYDTLLDCTSGCDSVNISGGNNLPDTVIFQACGPLLGDCDTANYCVTMESYFFNTLEAIISPEEPTVCFGSPGTWIYASGNGGTPPYEFSWSTGSTQDSIFVGIGTYILEVGDSSGCPPAYDTVYVDSFSLPIQAMAGIDTAYCNSFWPIQLNGSVQAATGGVWVGGDGAFSPDSFDLNATYAPGPQDSAQGFVDLYLITTSNGSCPPDTDTVTISLHVFNTSAAVLPQHVSCNGLADGEAKIQYQSGPPIVSYTWSTVPAEYGDTITGLAAGTYTVVITDSLGCDSTLSVTITEPPVLALSAVDTSGTSCNGYLDGTAEVGATGGTSPYQYSWSSGGNAAMESSLGAGMHTVTVTDTNGCVDSLTFTIDEPVGITLIMNALDVDCFDENTGVTTVNASGPYANYTYNWSSGSGNSIANNLVAGMYTVTVTYGNGCLDSDSIMVNQPDSISIVLLDTNISCFGLTDGAIGSIVSGGTPPYTYDWSNTATSVSIDGLAAGTYTLNIVDNNDCAAENDALIVEPASLEVDSVLGHVSCFGGSDGSASAVIIGGTAPYAYYWNTGSTNTAISGLSAGSYSLLITDSNDCQENTFFDITEPNALTIALDAQNVLCHGANDGWIKAFVGGGTTPYSYAWSAVTAGDSAFGLQMGPHQVTVTDVNGCTITADTSLTEPDPIDVQMSTDKTICLNTSAIIFSLVSGGNGGYQYAWSNGLPNGDSHNVSPTETTLYSVTVTDSNNCPPGYGIVRVTVKPVVFATMGVSSIPEQLCEGKSATIKGVYQGDLSNYTLTWNQGLGNQPGSFTVNPTETTLYTMTVEDECGFTETDSVLLEVNPTPILDFPEILGEGCAPLTVNFTTGITGIPISTYAWKFGNGLQSSEAEPASVYPNPGTYNVSVDVVSAKGCEAEGDGAGQVIVRPSPSAEFQITPNEVTTDQPTIRTEDLSEGALYYDYTISDGAVYDEPEIQHTFDEWGTYFIELLTTNAFGCTDTSKRSVYVKPVPRIDAPTAFTPSANAAGDGYFDPSAMNNDIFYLITEFVSSFHMVIYNRWGEVVFETFDPLQGWNGYYKDQMAPMAMYTWRADIKFVDNSELTETGYVSLLR